MFKKFFKIVKAFLIDSYRDFKGIKSNILLLIRNGIVITSEIAFLKSCKISGKYKGLMTAITTIFGLIWATH